MARIDELRDRSESLFAKLLSAETRPAPRGRGMAAAGRARTFSWFDPDDAVRAAALSFRLAAGAASKRRVNDGLAVALEHAEVSAGRAPAEQVRQGLALFVTHNRDGRRLLKPRAVKAAPKLFLTTPPPRRRSVSIGGRSPQLDYWREDALANEHHQHWHEVYPYAGLPPRDFAAWVTETPRDELVAVLEALQPETDWPAQLARATPPQVANLFLQVAQDDRVRDLPPEQYRTIFTLNDRQGELFFYMHQQMLARYDAELRSHGLERVAAFGPDEWDRPVPEGHDPVGLPRLGRRATNRRLPAAAVARLRELQAEVDEVLEDRQLRDAGGAAIGIDRTNFGEAVEAAAAQLRDLAPDRYRGLHNAGHGMIAGLSTSAPGVMVSTVTAIRDPIFWRWHKHIDDLNARWQDGESPYDVADAPDVRMSESDILLCRTEDLPADRDLADVGEELFAGTGDVPTVDELTTTMQTRRGPAGSTIRYLTHAPFTIFLRIENKASRDLQVTARLFLAPAEDAEDRRAWIEMDKFVVSLPKTSVTVVGRPDTEASVVKRPVDTDPATATGGGGDPEETSYCDCGWPYTLLLPRGRPGGMAFRLAVVCTDAAIDDVGHQAHCGSMSFCGAVDRYPDSRDMGYPFSRPIASIADMLASRPSMAARAVTIRHE